jgi:hypothetical protein
MIRVIRKSAHFAGWYIEKMAVNRSAIGNPAV